MLQIVEEIKGFGFVKEETHFQLQFVSFVGMVKEKLMKHAMMD